MLCLLLALGLFHSIFPEGNALKVTITQVTKNKDKQTVIIPAVFENAIRVEPTETGKQGFLVDYLQFIDEFKGTVQDFKQPLSKQGSWSASYSDDGLDNGPFEIELDINAYLRDAKHTDKDSTGIAVYVVEEGGSKKVKRVVHEKTDKRYVYVEAEVTLANTTTQDALNLPKP